MNDFIDSITEYFKSHPFDISQVNIIPYKNNSVPSVMLGKSHTEETKRKISLAIKGKKKTTITKKRMSESAIKRNRLSLVTHPNGNVETVLNVAEFCRKHNLNASNFKRMLRGGRPTSQGFTGFYLPSC